MTNVNGFSINSENLVHLFIQYYSIWRDYQTFYKNIDLITIEHNENGYPCFHYSDISSINNCNQKIVIIDNLTESIHSKKYFAQYDQDKFYIILSGGKWDCDKTVGLPINYELIYFPWFLIEMLDNYVNPHRFSSYIDKSYIHDSSKQFSFVGISGNVRPERDFLLDCVLNNVEHKNYIYRYSGQDQMAPTPVGADVIKILPGEFDPCINLYEKYYHSIGQTIPINLYNLANFLLVVETDIVNNHCFFITEKTIKALITGIPFVIVSTPYFLKNLKELGFTTYSELWDETYDDIIDYRERMLAVAKLCNKLHNFNWQLHKDQLELIAYKNKNNFLNTSSIINECFFNAENVLKKIKE
jgi:hypothetical protein